MKKKGYFHTKQNPAVLIKTPSVFCFVPRSIASSRYSVLLVFEKQKP